MGGRRFNLHSKFTPKKYVENYDIGDCISPLPDDILIAILSTLPLKEAGRTSVLSSRWRNLWRHTSCLNFDDHGALVKIVQELELLRVGRRKYVKWVNSVLQSHKGLALKEFRICFSLVRSSKKSITKWLEFAFKRHVRSLELNLLHSDDIHPSDKMYVFPEEFVKSHSLTISNYKTLKALCLKGVQVTGEAIEFLLHNSPSLEQLIIHSSDNLSSLEVRGHSLVLKHLEIWHCFNLTSMKVSAPSLQSLSVTEIEVLLLGDVPMLTNVYVYYTSSVLFIQRVVPTLFCCLSQLEILTLDLRDKRRIAMLNFPEMPKLKKLVIMDSLSQADESLLSLASFINASPRLQEFVLKQTWCVPQHQRTDREIEKIPNLWLVVSIHLVFSGGGSFQPRISFSACDLGFDESIDFQSVESSPSGVFLLTCAVGCRVASWFSVGLRRGFPAGLPLVCPFFFESVGCDNELVAVAADFWL